MVHKTPIYFFTLTLTSILYVIIIFFFNFNLVVFDESFYKQEFAKYEVYSNLEDQDVDNINKEVLQYLKFSDGNLQNEFFTEREKSHMKDVKGFFDNSSRIYLASLVSIVALFLLSIFFFNSNFKLIIKNVIRIIFFGSFLTLIIFFLIFIISIIDFNFFFGKFHETFFPEGTYVFNPEFEKIVVLYPENLFFDALILIMKNIILSTTILFFLSFVLLLKIYNENFIHKIIKFSVGKNIK
ncbi:DUF1461 domain-containing protein [Candidatus Woesearchaeota archaeon]|nr:DUF1461 domain-containing protein [Candidatus Woesearchaeota archaeon]